MVSVCMTTYNGEKFIREQIASILCQLQDHDELIISDDGSTDSTIEIVNSLGDVRIKFYQNCFKNVVKNFEFTISKAVGDYIFLSDQDDIWHRNKVESYLDCFLRTEADLVISNLAFIDENGSTRPGEFYKNKFKSSVLSNVVKNNFIGCSMAFRKRTIQWFRPFPTDLPMHDWWIGLVIAKLGKIVYLEEKLLFYRRHDNNVTSGEKSSFYKILKWRWLIVKNLY